MFSLSYSLRKLSLRQYRGGSYFAKVNTKFSTPHRAVLIGGIIGIAAIFSDNLIVIAGQPLTANIITMAVFGALFMYIMAMSSLLKLRKIEPNLDRPFKTPMYPIFPIVALIIAVFSLIAMAWYNTEVCLIFIGIMILGYIYFHFTGAQRVAAPIDDLLESQTDMK